MKTNVLSIKKNKVDSMDWTVIEILRDLLDDLENGNVSYNKCFVGLLSDDDPESDMSIGFRMAGMTSVETISLLEIQKDSLLKVINEDY